MKSSHLFSMGIMCFSNAFVLKTGLVEKLDVREQVFCGICMMVYALIYSKD
jgi:hypothetical protein